MDEQYFVKLEQHAHDAMSHCQRDPAGCADYRTQILQSLVWLDKALGALNEYQERNRRAA